MNEETWGPTVKKPMTFQENSNFSYQKVRRLWASVSDIGGDFRAVGALDLHRESKTWNMTSKLQGFSVMLFYRQSLQEQRLPLFVSPGSAQLTHLFPCSLIPYSLVTFICTDTYQFFPLIISPMLCMEPSI